MQFNKKRHEIYISQRESGKVISLDASRYTLKKSWALPANPNSLLLSADGQTLFVTVKQPFNKTTPLKPGQRRTYRPERAIKNNGSGDGPFDSFILIHGAKLCTPRTIHPSRCVKRCWP
ncbi:putative periplasmic protein [Klebsiella pneumoniae]|uniref:Putative periplasmic protein n=1 Tax=Klebsiella pneumoniae TaxID=573 RepID=A0A377XNT2_KLEPN|nr:putative periplasmic protein [Klebsiella pneumoniae]